MSWDHLSSKALLHIAPDQVIVWNDVQRQEAVEMHGLPAERSRRHRRAVLRPVVRRASRRARARSSAAPSGCDPDRPFVSVGALGAEPDAGSAGAGAGEALDRGAARAAPIRVCASRRAGAAASRAGQGVGGVEPRRLRQRRVSRRATRSTATRRTTTSTRSTYSGAVVGLVTSAFLEAAIVGRPVLTLHAARVSHASGGDGRTSATC